MALKQITVCYTVDSCLFGHAMFQDLPFTVLEELEHKFDLVVRNFCLFLVKLNVTTSC